MKGKRLDKLPLLWTNWKTWRELYPSSRVLSLNTGYSRPYRSERADFMAQQYDLLPDPIYPVSTKDERLPSKEKVVGVEVEGVRKAYPLRKLQAGVLMDDVAGRRLAIFAKPSAETGVVFDPQSFTPPLEFAYKGGAILDSQTNSRWDLTGKAVSGPLKGEKLTQLPSITCYWFAWVTVFPETKVY